MGRISQPRVLSEKPVMKELSKDVDQVIEGPIVAVQYPSVAPFTVNESTATELSVKYSHLKNLDVDDKKAYKELVAAIKDVSSNRIQINKEEDAVKKPLNAFRKLVLDTGKALRAAFEPIEESLKAEKDRIDTVLADREAAKRKVWQDNLDNLKVITSSYKESVNLIDLKKILEEIRLIDLNDEDYGDLFSEAEEEKDWTLTHIESLIKYKTEQEEFEAKRIAFEKEQAEAAERERIANEEREAMAKRIADLEAASKTDTAEPEDNYQSEVSYYGLNDSPSDNHTPLKSICHSEISKDKDFVIGRPETRYTPSKPKDYPDLTIDKHYADDDPIQEVKPSYTGTFKGRVFGLESVGNINGDSALCMFIATLARANNMSVITKTKEENEAVERVKSTLVKAIGYLEQFDNDGEN